jgi:hypothetical protein
MNRIAIDGMAGYISITQMQYNTLSPTRRGFIRVSIR